MILLTVGWMKKTLVKFRGGEEEEDGDDEEASDEDD